MNTLYGQVDTVSYSKSIQANSYPDSTAILFADTITPKVHRRNTLIKATTSTEPIEKERKQSKSYYAKDTTPTLKDPTTAALLAIIPGAGQIYNKKWWKLPIVYAGLGASGYCVYHFGSLVKKYQDEYYFRLLGMPSYYNPDLAGYSDVDLMTARNANRYNMEISIGVCAIFYALTIIDAVVDAHLFYFDISDELSLKIEPAIYNNYGLNTFSTGVALKFNIK